MDPNLIAAMLLTAGLTGGAALALWQLPWSERDLREMDEDARATGRRVASARGGRERRGRARIAA
jgi:hypothetical protein